jgi:hypothetical protein
MEGLAPVVVQELAGVLRSLVDAGTCRIVLGRQHAAMARALSRRVLFMERGRIGPRGGGVMSFVQSCWQRSRMRPRAGRSPCAPPPRPSRARTSTASSAQARSRLADAGGARTSRRRRRGTDGARGLGTGLAGNFREHARTA